MEPTPTPTKERTGTPLAVQVDRALIGILFAMAFCAPLSISITQAFWVMGLLLGFWRFWLFPRPVIHWHRLLVPLLLFIGLSFLSALCSYDRMVSLSKLRSVALFTIVLLVSQHVPSPRVVRLLCLTLLAGSMISVIYTLGDRLVGRGIRVSGLSADSPLRAAGIRDGDTILGVDGKSVRNPQQLVRALSFGNDGAEPARIRIYRFELTVDVTLPRGALLPGNDDLRRLGIGTWTRGREWRASGFYGHYATFAEVLQLLASLVVGLLVAMPRKMSWRGAGLAAAILGMGGAMLLTVTRGPGLGLMVSACLIILFGLRRRAFIPIVLLAAIAIPSGLFVLREKRNISFIDQGDTSIQWRGEVYREGLHLLLAKPRHWLVGIGMDSLTTRWQEWGMFDHGRLPRGHLHCTFLQIALERGLPALAAWLWLLGAYGLMLVRLLRGPRLDGWFERGLTLGALGGLIGFFLSGLVHYNMGDSEVIMVVYFIMGLMLYVDRSRDGRDAGAQPPPSPRPA